MDTKKPLDDNEINNVSGGINYVTGEQKCPFCGATFTGKVCPVCAKNLPTGTDMIGQKKNGK